MIKDIVPVTVFPYTASKININDVLVTLGESANAQWTLLDENGASVGAVGRVFIEGEEYLAWGDDDDYLADLVASKVGVELVP